MSAFLKKKVYCPFKIQYRHEPTNDLFVLQIIL